MRYLAVVLFLGFSSQVFAQISGGSLGGLTGGSTGGGLGGLSGGSSGGSGNLTTGGSRTGGATTGQGRSGQGGFTNTGGGNTGGVGGLGGLTGGNFGGAGGGAGGTSFSVSNTNLLSSTYSNPLAAGKPGTQITGTTQAMTGAQVGSSMNIRGVGFGQASFGNVSTGGAAGRTGTLPGGLNSGFTTGGASGIGGTGMNRGMANTNNMNNQGGGTSRLHYTVTLVDPPAAPANAVLKADVSAILGRSSSIKNPSGIEITTEGQKVILRGKVASDSERRLVEGMVRLTPGVREVVNELQAP